MQTTTVTTYDLKAASGRHIRKATKVTFADGYEVRFTERMPARLAVPQAVTVRERAEIIAGPKAELLGDAAVVRFDEAGRPWLLNRRDRGWGEQGRVFAVLNDILLAFNVELGEATADEHGTYIPVRRARKGN